MPIKKLGDLVIKGKDYEYIQCTCGHEFRVETGTLTKLTRCKWCNSKEKHLGMNDKQVEEMGLLFITTINKYEEESWVGN